MDFEQLINNLRNKLDDSTKGSVSEDLLAIVGELRSQKQTINDNNETIRMLEKMVNAMQKEIDNIKRNL